MSFVISYIVGIVCEIIYEMTDCMQKKPSVFGGSERWMNIQTCSVQILLKKDVDSKL